MGNQDKKVVIFDLDGTLIERHLWLGILKHHLKTKENLFWSFWYLITHFTVFPLWKLKLISTKKFYQSWARDMPIMMKGLKLERGREIFNGVVEKYLLPSTKAEVLNRLKEHQKNGFLTILTSGSFQEVVEIIAKSLNIDFALGTELEVGGNKFTGRIIPPLCFEEGKKEKLEKLFSEKNLQADFKTSFAYSDSIFDLPILNLVGNPVVINPDKKLLKVAKTRGWQII